MRTLGWVLVGFGIVLVGCSDDSGADAQGTGGTGGLGNPAGNAGSSGMTSVPVFTSNLPAVTPTVTDPTGTGLTLVSLDVEASSTATLNYVEWFGEVMNTGTATLCYPTADFTFADGAGTALWTDSTYGYALPYIVPSAVFGAACLAPGETGLFWSNDLPLTAFVVGNVATVTITLGATASPEATRFSQSLTADFTEDTLYADGSHWLMTGSLTPTQEISNVRIRGFAKNASGLFYDTLEQMNLGTITANTTWTFTTDLSLEGSRPAGVFAVDDFTVGAASARVIDDSPMDTARAAQASSWDRQSEFDATRASEL